MTAGVIEAGVDTWRLLFKTTRAHGAEVFSLGDYKAHWMPGLSLLAVEGHPSPGGLCPSNGLGNAYETVMHLLDEEVGSYEFKGLSRLDATATNVFGRGQEGIAFLQGFAALDWPRLKPEVIGKPPETVYLIARNGRGKKLARAYDSGLLRGTHERGVAIRLEDQGRFPAGARPTMEIDPRARFHRRFVPLWQSMKGVRVASLPVLTETVAARLSSGEITRSQAERMIGFLHLETAGATCERRTWYRRRRELRERGLVVADGFFERVEVDVASVLEAALESPAWGATG
jgi:hypothetical protein